MPLLIRIPHQDISGPDTNSEDLRSSVTLLWPFSAMTVAQIEPGSAQHKELEAELQSKFLKYGWTQEWDDTKLAEYIASLLVSGVEIQDTIEAIVLPEGVGDKERDLIKFVRWLPDYLSDLVATPSPPQQQQQHEAPRAPNQFLYGRPNQDSSRPRQPGRLESDRTRQEAGGSVRSSGPATIYTPGIGVPLSGILQGSGNRPNGSQGPVIPAVRPQAQQASSRGLGIDSATAQGNVPGLGGATLARPATEDRPAPAGQTLPFRRAGEPYPYIVPKVKFRYRPLYTKPSHTRKRSV